MWQSPTGLTDLSSLLREYRTQSVVPLRPLPPRGQAPTQHSGRGSWGLEWLSKDCTGTFMGPQCTLMYTEVLAHIVSDHCTHMIPGEHASLEKTETAVFSHSFFFYSSISLSLSPFTPSTSSLPAFPSGMPPPPLSSIVPITFSLFSFWQGCRDNVLSMWELFSGLPTFTPQLIKFLETKDVVGIQSPHE